MKEVECWIRKGGMRETRVCVYNKRERVLGCMLGRGAMTEGKTDE